jgi:toxin ParE1/3/4
MVLTIEALQDGPRVVGTKIRDEIAAGLRSIPVKLNRRNARHSVFFRVSENAREIVVLRILHVAMDPARHVAVQPKT